MKLTFLVIVIWLLSACSDNQEYTIPLNSIDSTTAANLMTHDDSVVVLDVRTPIEYAKGHIEGSINIPIKDKQFPQKVAQLDSTKTYIVHCAVNPRNGRADKSISIMDGLGFDNLYSLDGGITAWYRQGLPLVN